MATPDPTVSGITGSIVFHELRHLQFVFEMNATLEKAAREKHPHYGTRLADDPRIRLRTLGSRNVQVQIERPGMKVALNPCGTQGIFNSKKSLDSTPGPITLPPRRDGKIKPWPPPCSWA